MTHQNNALGVDPAVGTARQLGALVQLGLQLGEIGGVVGDQAGLVLVHRDDDGAAVLAVGARRVFQRDAGVGRKRHAPEIPQDAARGRARARPGRPRPGGPLHPHPAGGLRHARGRAGAPAGHGGFPQLLLAPVNFDALYAQHLQQMQQAPSTETIN